MIQIQKGTKDLIPQEAYKWQHLEDMAHTIALAHNFKRIDTPTFEATELFARGMGDSSDVVNKEMYTFIDKGGRSITLKPEGTAGVVRAYIEDGLFQLPTPLKMFYITPVFRYEKPQNGRLREHHQFGIEIFGSASPYADLEAIITALDYLYSVGLEKISLDINNIGCRKCRPAYNEILKKYLADKDDQLCEQCKKRRETNPLRIFDCKNESCQKVIADAPKVSDHVCDECKGHFTKLCKLLDAAGEQYNVNSKLVRGLDYYTKVVFEFKSDDLGAQSTVCGGGRYDNLIEDLGGQNTPAVGFGLGLERLALILKNTGKDKELEEKTPDFYIAAADDESREYILESANELRMHGYVIETDIMERSLKAQLKHADKIHAQAVIVIGQEEMKKNLFKIKNLETGEEKQVSNFREQLIRFAGMRG